MDKELGLRARFKFSSVQECRQFFASDPTVSSFTPLMEMSQSDRVRDIIVRDSCKPFDGIPLIR